MQRLLFLFVTLLSISVQGFGQLTLQIYALPPSTPPNASIFIAGNFNNWNPGDPVYQFRETNESYSLTFNNLPPNTSIEFKCTQGSWEGVEGNASGEFLPNRVYHYAGGRDTLRLSIESWERKDPQAGSTASPRVKVISTSFDIPQLGRQRRIWIYLPEDYAYSNKRYPVLYMHDGQNLFDRVTSFSGEWQVDETLDRWTGPACIVVGIDNGGQHRMSEYSPWDNRYAKGEGPAYADFVVKTLKPFIDKNYRTLKSRRYTGIAGSSMGGLISLYTAIEYQQTFGFAGILSPSLWIDDNWARHIQQKGRKGPLRLYLLAGKGESETIEEEVWRLARTLNQSGFPAARIAVDIDEDGAHAEWYWAREFPGVLRWWMGN